MRYAEAVERYNTLIERLRETLCVSGDCEESKSLHEQLDALNKEVNRKYLLGGGLEFGIHLEMSRYGRGVQLYTLNPVFTSSNLKQAAAVAGLYEKWVAGELDELPPSILA
jgi:hypothetical protein